MTKSSRGWTFGKCIWPACRQYELGKEIKLCQAHAAIVIRTAEKLHPAVTALAGDMAAHDEATAPTPQRQPDQQPTEGTIYVLSCGGHIKVGYTGRNLQDRLKEYPPNWTVTVAFPGKRGDETRIKRKFSHLRTHGSEWLPCAPQVTEWVDQMVRQHGHPDTDITCGPARYQVPRPHSNQGGIRPRGWVAGTGTISA